MADKRISQLVDRGTVANNDVVPIVVSGASTTNKATISSIQTFMQGNLDLGVTSVGLSMPSAFTVTGSPVTSSGNISVVGAGTVSQYIRGDGSLADFPQGGGGGGASINYYLNLSVSQGSIGGIAYSQMSRVPVFGAGTDTAIASNGYIASFITDAGNPALLEIPAGNWNFETYFSANSGGGSPTFYIELYKVNSGGTATLIASNSGTPESISLGTNINPYFSALAVPTTSLTLTDRLAIRIFVSNSGRTITLHTENGHLCQVITTFTTGLTALNGLTAQVQNFATGTSGTDFGISSASTTHTFNLPTASATNRGALSSADWSTFNGKQAALNGTGFVKISGTTITYDNSTYLTTGTAASTYLPLTGGTLSNNLFITGGGLQVSGSTSANRQVAELYTSGSVSRLAASYVGASSYGSLELLTSGLARLTIADTGGVTLTGALSGTSARFNGSASVPLGLVSSAFSGIEYTRGSTIFGYIGTENNASGGMRYNSVSGNFEHKFYNNSNLSLTLESTGAATFSSSVQTTNIGINFAPQTDRLFVYNGSGTNSLITAQQDGTGDLIRLNGNSGANRFNITQAGAATFSSSVGINGVAPSYPLYVRTGTNQRARFVDNGGLFQFGILNDAESAYSDLSLGNSAVVIKAAGNVGIGTASPSGSYSLTLAGNASSTTGGINLRQNTTDTLYIGNPSVANTTDIEIWNPRDGYLRFATNNTERMRITSGGDVVTFGAFRAYNTFFGISNSTGSTPYGFFGRRGSATGSGNDMTIFAESGLGIYTYTNGGVSPAGPFVASGGTSWTNGSSDIRKKKNFETTQGLAEILQIEPIKYHFNEDEDDSKKRLGFKAQNLLDIIPEMVSETGELAEDGTSYLTITPDYILPILVKAIQELKTEIDSLKNQIK